MHTRLTAVAFLLLLGSTVSSYAQSGSGSPQEAPKLLGVADISAWHAPLADQRLAYGGDPLQFADLYLPAGPGPHPVVVFLHGGCWLSEFDITHTSRFAAAMAAAGIATWSVEYRKVGDPGGGWPGTFHDVERGAAHLLEIAADHDLDLARVVVAGHSAGGHLALWLGARSTGRLRKKPFRKRFPLGFRGVLALAPAPDLARLHDRQVCGGVIDKLMGGGPLEVPGRYRLADATHFAPIGLEQIVMVGRHDAGWSASGRHYFEVDSARERDVALVEAADSGHFEMIDPASSTWPLVVDSARKLLGLAPVSQ